MASTEWYKQWFNSPYYHKLYFERDEHEARKFIDRLLDHLQPPEKSRVLDIACGKGRHSRMLAAHGLDVTGFDISVDSINYANQFSAENLHFYVHDMRLPFWVNYFDHAFNFFTSFGYFPSRREHDDAMRTIAYSLKPGGIVLFDYLNVHYAEDNLVQSEVKQIDGTNYEIVRWHDDKNFFKKITITDLHIAEPLSFTEVVAKLTLGDFSDMLSFQKLQVKEVFGDYNLQPYHSRNTPRMIIVAQKSSPVPVC